MDIKDVAVKVEKVESKFFQGKEEEIIRLHDTQQDYTNKINDVMKTITELNEKIANMQVQIDSQERSEDQDDEDDNNAEENDGGTIE